MSIENILNKTVNRREFLERTGKAAVGLAGLLGGCATVGFKETGPVVYPPLKGHKVQPLKEGCFIGGTFGLSLRGGYNKGSYKNLEYLYGRAPKIAHLAREAAHYGFPTKSINNISEDNLIPCVTWDISMWVKNYTLKGISEGAVDKSITNFAEEAAKVKSPYFLRTLIEMTLPAQGNWPWAGQPQYYSKAFSHIWQIFENEGANEYMTWIWNPYVGQDWGADMESYYPGDQYVDWIAFNGYNLGSSQTWFKRWDTFDDLFKSAYKTTRKNHPNKPIMIAEFACNEEPGKSAWIKDAFNKLKHEYTGIKAAMWWDEDWKLLNITSLMRGSVTSSKESHEAFKQAISDPYFIGAK